LKAIKIIGWLEVDCETEDCRQKLIHRWWVRLKRQLHNANCIRNDKGEGEGEE
jgi:hypothetical protein